MDSPYLYLYLGIECKSLEADKVDKIYFSRYFKSTKEGHQIERETRLLHLTGRNGFLVIEARRHRPYRNEAFFIPWHIVKYYYEGGCNGIELEVVTQAPSILKQGGEYTIDDQFINLLRKRYREKREE